MRLLPRTLIKLRWSMAALGILLLVAMLISARYGLSLNIALGVDGPDKRPRYACLSAVKGLLQLDRATVGRELPLLQAWSLGTPDAPLPGWDFNLRPPEFFAVPLWTLVVTIMGLALAGFWAKRKQPKPDFCQSCNHQLQGVAVCPECGTTARATPS